jgi:peptidoglycan/xylan/chitin deacetylase (PgdA/CDA1 family)
MNRLASSVSGLPRLRLDRVVSLALAGPLGQGLRGVRRGLTSRARAADETPIPVLMYHSIADDVDTSVHPYFRTVTSAARFAEQVQHLCDQGYQGVTLADAASRLQGAHRAGDAVRKPVVLSFDDGFRDFHTTAMPVLQAAGFSATVFVSTDFIGKPFLTGRPCLNTHELRELCASGIELGSHSASHRRLVDLSLHELAQEVRVSKQSLQDITGKAVHSFSYPYRFPQQNQTFTNTLAELLKEAGYRAGVTTTLGRAAVVDDPLFLPRLPVNDCDDMALFAAKLNGHYDWLRSGQVLGKHSRAWMQKLGWHS